LRPRHPLPPAVFSLTVQVSFFWEVHTLVPLRPCGLVSRELSSLPRLLRALQDEGAGSDRPQLDVRIDLWLGVPPADPVLGTRQGATPRKSDGSGSRREKNTTRRAAATKEELSPMGLARRKGGVFHFEERNEAYLRSSGKREKETRKGFFFPERSPPLFPFSCGGGCVAGLRSPVGGGEGPCLFFPFLSPNSKVQIGKNKQRPPRAPSGERKKNRRARATSSNIMPRGG
jgi:hypothetical protein